MAKCGKIGNFLWQNLPIFCGKIWQNLGFQMAIFCDARYKYKGGLTKLSCYTLAQMWKSLWHGKG